MTPNPAESGNTADMVDRLVGIETDSPVYRVRKTKPVTRDHTQLAYEALFAAGSDDVTLVERHALALFVAALHADQPAIDAHRDALRQAGGSAELADVLAAEGTAARHPGPYGDYPSDELSAENEEGPEYRLPDESGAVLGDHLAAMVEHTHYLVLHPRDAVEVRIQLLLAADWTPTGIVTCSQLVAFLEYQLRLVHGLRVLAGQPAPTEVERPDLDADEDRSGERLSPQGRTPNAVAAPTRFTTAILQWDPWLPAVPADELTSADREALVDRAREKSEYFRLLVRDRDILHARTSIDFDVFKNTEVGLPRAERELAATAVSRTNGCIYCASVHARFAGHYSKDPEPVQRLLDDGVEAEQSDRWRAVIDAAVALTRSRPDFGADQVAALSAVGLDDLEISDVIHGSAFFNWANRLMLSLGEPQL